jgi:hypothetical protein
MDNIECFEHIAPQPAQLRHNQRISFRKPSQEFINTSLFGVFARGDLHGDPFVNQKFMSLGIFQEQMPLRVGILFVGADPNVTNGFHSVLGRKIER